MYRPLGVALLRPRLNTKTHTKATLCTSWYRGYLRMRYCSRSNLVIVSAGSAQCLGYIDPWCCRPAAKTALPN